MAAFTALYDACVLYPATIRDLLMHLALTDLFRAKWSKDIHEEWITSLLKRRPDLTREKLERVRELMDSHVRDCLVEDYEQLIPALRLPDPHDRHVLAAAIRGRADIIVTYNLSDFPAEELSKYGIEAQHPDAFVAHLLELDETAVLSAARKQRQNLHHPPVSQERFVARLEELGLVQTAAHLRQGWDDL